MSTIDYDNRYEREIIKRALLQKIGLVRRGLVSLTSSRRTFEIPGEQGDRFRQRVRSNIEGPYNNTCLSTHVTRHVENCGLPFA